MTSTKKLSLAAALTFVGAAVSVYQTHHFYSLRSGMSGLKTFCQIGSFDCVAIETSRFAEILPNLPLSALAAAWLTTQLIILLIGLASQSKSAARFATLQSFISLTASLVYLGIMIGVLKTGCILCLALDACNLIVAGLLFSMRNEFKTSSRDTPLWKWLGGSGLGTVVIAWILSRALNPMSGISDAQISEYVDSMLLTKPVSVPFSAAEVVSGPENAPITIVKFSDFECPACKMGAEGIHPILSEYKNKVRFVFKNHPLDQSCNRKITQPMHRHACELARIGLCAQAKNQFHSIYETFFTHQEALAKSENLLNSLKGFGISNVDELKSCSSSSDTQTKLTQQIEEGIALGITSTPTFFVNGIKIAGGLPTPAWKQLIERLLKK